MPKTFAQKLAEAKELGEQSDELNEEIVAEFLTAASPVIQMLRDIEENMSDGISFAAKAKGVLHQIDIGLLKDPLSISVLAKLSAGAGESAAVEDNKDES